MRHFAILLLLTSTACSDKKEPKSDTLNANGRSGESAAVITTSFPVDYLTKRLIGNAVTVSCINPIGEDPPSYQPPADTIADLTSATLIIQNGAGFEKWMETASLPAGKIVDSSKGIALILLKGETHSHGKKGSHSHAGIDPHLWSDPMRYAIQAQTIADSLSDAFPAQATQIKAELQRIQYDLNSLHDRMKKATLLLRSTKLAANHPAFNYLGEAIDVDFHSFDFDPEEKPTSENIKEWATWVKTSDNTLLIWESVPVESVSNQFKGAVHLALDPLEQPLPNSDYNYLNQAEANILMLETIAQTVQTKSNPSEK